MPRSTDNAHQAIATAIVSVEALEGRQMLIITPTPYEQFLLELINRARASPSAEAERLGVSLNEGLADGTITADAKQPLAMNYSLVASSRGHLTWLQQNSKFQHEGSGGSTPQQRMASAGYTFGGTSGSEENLALSLASTVGDIAAHVETLYNSLFTDGDVAGRGHRLNLLNGSMREVGSGVATGDYTYNGSAWKAILIGQDYAYTNGNAFLTGVAYDDVLKLDNFYSPGEGVAGVTITATSKTTGHTFTTTTNQAGGYQLQLAPDTYNIVGSRSGKSRTVLYGNVTIGSDNVKRDFTGAQFDTLPAVKFAQLTSKGILGITGTSDDDTITVEKTGTNYIVTLNGTAASFSVAATKSIQIDAGDGNDSISLDSDVMAATIHGGAGNDTIAGGDGNDQIWGGDGDDRLSGNGGNDVMHGEAGDDNLNGNGGKNTLYGDDGSDRLNGSSGPDKLYGGAGDDRLYGNAGDDVLDGGGNNDRLYAGDGNDILLGGSGKDRLYGEGGNDTLTGGKDIDVIDGGSGKDKWLDRVSLEIALGIE